MSLKRITKHLVKPVAKGTVSATPKDKTRKSIASKNREKMMTHSLSTEHQVTNTCRYLGEGLLVFWNYMYHTTSYHVIVDSSNVH